MSSNHIEALLRCRLMIMVRRLAAATGLPFGISDEFVEAEYPCEAPGFNSSAPIRTNIKIARITSRILTGSTS